MKLQEFRNEAVLTLSQAGLRPRRVLHLIGTFAQGGSERQAVQLAGLTKQEGSYEVELAVLDPEGVLRGEAKQVGFPDVPSYPLSSFHDWNMMVQLRRLAAHLRARAVDIVHTHDFYSNVFGMIAAALAQVPVRIASRRELGGMRTLRQLWVERRAYALAHAIIANSGAVRHQLVAEGVPAKKVSVIHNGLNLDRFAPVGPEQRARLLAWLGLPEDPQCRFVTIVANLRHAVKDHPVFLQSARIVHQHCPQAYFVVAGEGELLEPMRRLAAELEIAQSTFFLGRCERVAELLAASDVCVLSSRFEGFSNAILEYMAAAKPVVATKVGGAAEAVIEGQTGYLVAAGDDRALAMRIVQLLRNPAEARTLGEQGREVVKREFSCAAQLRRTEELYSSLLNARSARKERA
jgi:L-malate glycosyltransferase